MDEIGICMDVYMENLCHRNDRVKHFIFARVLKPNEMIDTSANLIRDSSIVKIKTTANAKYKWEFEIFHIYNLILKFISGQIHQEQS